MAAKKNKNIYIYIYDKIRGKMDKSNSYNGINGNILFFIHRTSSD